MILSIAVSCVIFAAVIMFVIRLAGDAGFKLPSNKVFSFVTENKYPVRPDETDEKYTLLKIFLYALGFRLIVFMLGWVAYGIFAKGAPIGILEYCEKWNLWDAPHYIEIAKNGYGQHVENGQHLFLVFFPLYPVMMKLFASIIQNYVISGLLVSFLSYSFGCVLMYKLVRIDYSKEIARKSVIFLSISPFAFFFGSLMTESLFFLLIAATFLAIRKHKWWLAGILGALAALTRPFGVFMLIPAVVEWITHEKPVELIRLKKGKELLKKFLALLPVLIMIAGILIYLYINYATEGDPFIFSKYQREHWYQTLQFFGKTVNMLSDKVFSPTDNWSNMICIFLSGLLTAVISSVIILLGVRRTRSMYSVFMIACFFFNVGASWPLSLSRYMTCMLPAFWVLATLTEKRKNLDTLITVTMAIAFGIMLTGYMTLHQIM